MARKKGMSRRDFFRVTWLGAMGIGISGFGAASIQMLWPNLRGGFGSKIRLGSVDDVKAQIAAEPGGLLKLAEARTWLIAYDGSGAKDVYKGITNGGFLASYWKCAHLGCTVPRCDASHWLECPCHGSRYNKAGEYQYGPAPRGLTHFPVTIEDGSVVIDTATQSPGPPRGTDTIKQSPAGPHCVG